MPETNGCLGEGASNTDFLLGATDNLPHLVTQDNIRYEYNQGAEEWSKSSCTIFSAIGALSDLFNYEFTVDKIKKWDAESYKKGRVKGQGWYTKNAVSLCANLWNSDAELVSKYGKVAYYLIDMGDTEIIKDILSKGYNICTGYYGNSKYQKDYKADAILDGTEFGASTYGHAVNLVYKNGVLCVKDNYKGRKATNKLDCNYYELKHPACEIEHWHNTGFLYTKVAENNYEEVKRLNEFKTKLLVTIENNSALWHLTNDKNFQAILHYTNEKLRKKVIDCDEQLKRFS